MSPTSKSVASDSPELPRHTSITAQTVLTVVVSMSPVELDTLADMLRGIDRYSLTDAQSTVRDGFLTALDSVR